MAAQYYQADSMRGFRAIALSSGGNVRKGPGSSFSFVRAIQPGGDAGQLTGKAAKLDNGEIWAEVAGNGEKVWGSTKNFKAVNPTPASYQAEGKEELQERLNRIISLDKKTYENGVAIAQKLEALKRQGKDVSALEARARKVLIEFLQRQSELKSRNTWFKVNTWATEGIAKVKKFFGLSGIGEPITISTTAIVLGAVLLITGAVVGYFLFQQEAKSKTNYKETAEIKSILDKYEVTPQDRERLGNEMQKQLDTSAQKAANRETWEMLKTAMLVIGGGIVAVKLLNYADSRKAPVVAQAA